MSVRIVAFSGLKSWPPEWREAEYVISWEGAKKTIQRVLSGLYALLPRPLSPLAQDLLDIASIVYSADLLVPRGRNEQWVRALQLLVPVRQADFWEAESEALSYLLYVLTRDSFQFMFVPRERPAAEEPIGQKAFAADTVCLLSGGLDSLAGAWTLLRTGRRPLLVSHQSGNPAVRAAQEHVRRLLRDKAGEAFGEAALRLHPARRRGSFSEASGEPREPSQRTRSFLFMAVALGAAEALGVPEAYIPENGILTLALPLSVARIGGLSTRSTHPKVVGLMNALAARAGWGVTLVNPFVYYTKAELLRDILRPFFAPKDLQKTVSCWAAGRQHRQCGGCVPCLIRRLAMLAAGLPDEAYERDVLRNPEAYRGTEAYANLVDLLHLAADFRRLRDMELVSRAPELLDAVAYGISLPEALRLYRRFGEEVFRVVTEYFPQAAQLLASNLC